LRFLRARLGRLIRDIGRKIAGQPQLQAVFQWPLTRASRASEPHQLVLHVDDLIDPGPEQITFARRSQPEIDSRSAP
jgi:hypothetical protein